jgi:C-terminal processing protease CtpA/Prc
MKSQFLSHILILLSLLLCVGFSVAEVSAQQKMDSVTKQQVMSMLRNVKNAIKKDYFDANFGGMDIDARFQVAEEKLKGTETLGQAFAVIAQAVVDLNDSHTVFYPPARPAITEYGWRMKMFGDKAFITGVKEKSDAEAKGLIVGDEVVKLNGFHPTRKDIWKMIYYYQVINPQTKVVLEVKNPAGEVQQLEIASKVTPLKAIVNFSDSIDFNEAVREGDKLASSYKHYFKDIGSVLIWKMPDFAFSPGEVGGMIEKAKGKQALILDLRGNPGGYVVTLEKLAGYFFDKDVKIADIKGRKPMEPQVGKSQGTDVFKGKVMVLIDSNSASAAEIFARLMQLEKRGIVLGDLSAGAVMQSKGVGFDAGTSTVISYGMNLTRADVIMSDGKSLEHVGVTPDEIIIPTGKDLAEQRDPVLARALELVGMKVDSGDAGKFFPAEKFIERKSNVAIHLEF